jgi:hypothetical protein
VSVLELQLEVLVLMAVSGLLLGRARQQRVLDTIMRRGPELDEDYSPDVNLGRYPARLMQLLESSLIIGRICRRIMEESPKTTVITLHDQLLTTPDRVDYVEQVMREEFEKVGLFPTFKRK